MIHECLAGMGAAVLLADAVYNVPANVIVDSCRRALTAYDVITSMVKAWVFGLIISAVRAHPVNMAPTSISVCLSSVPCGKYFAYLWVSDSASARAE
jgi:ABC-type transporter Mla maintaining outer membrane lipid asymmetry permease subunit MlaE